MANFEIYRQSAESDIKCQTFGRKYSPRTEMEKSTLSDQKMLQNSKQTKLIDDNGCAKSRMSYNSLGFEISDVLKIDDKDYAITFSLYFR